MENKLKHSRFKDASWFPREEVYILIGGAGGIGSWVSLLLARAGFKPFIYDFDLLEEHNLAGQLYPKKYIGKSKVEALSKVIEDFADEIVIVLNERITRDSPTNSYVVSAFDNMEARKAMFYSWKEGNDGNPLSIFIDGRLSAEHMQILCVKGDDKSAIERYEQEYLFEDSEVDDAPCTLKQTSHAAAMIAAHMVGFFTNHYSNIVEGSVNRAVPFYWEYFIPIDMLETKTSLV